MSHSNLAECIRNCCVHLAIIGQGYAGLPLAVEFARAGFAVTGIDSDPDRVDALQAGQSCTPSSIREVPRGGILAPQGKVITL
jgi:UDP-N-acetyl-D-mannosaminuronate dehydrogenase